ncbi:hypothetical protein AAG906_017765 [Vitis piasezkii]
MAAASYSSQWSYDVFLSFRGEDTRNNFTAHLYDALCRRGINTFIDDDKLGRGEAISPALFEAIERSMYSIIVLSENYASSRWCLDELVKIVECMKSKRQRVLPIFYNVDPSDVGEQRGKIGEALAKHQENLENLEREKVWREALTQVSNLSGWDSRNKSSPMFQTNCLECIQVMKNLVGIFPRIKEVESCFDALLLKQGFVPKGFIVLDDVKDQAVLECLTENQYSFKQGSRIIVTTKDKELLTSNLVNYYEIRKLNDDEAMKVLSHYSSKHKLPEDDFMELSRRVTTYAQGLPLALKILGSFLFGMERHEWKSYLEKLKDTPNPKINQVLRLSYDELDHKVKDTFLDIVWLWLLPACGIRTLLDKSFLTIFNNKLQMHDLIQHMGMEVVREKSPKDPGKWSRLWSHQDISHVLKKNTGTEEVEGIFLDLSNLQEIHFTSKGFERMNKLRLLKVYKSHICKDSECPFKTEQCEVHFSHNFKFHSNDLRSLYWHGYSLKSLPHDFNPENLVELNMPYNHIEQLWKGIKDLEKLKFMELSHSECLVEIPDLERASNLERLVLEESIELESLQILILSGCSKLKKFPEIKGYMKHIKELPSSIEYATGLVILDLTNCKMLRSLPNDRIPIRALPTSFADLRNLQVLSFHECKGLNSPDFLLPPWSALGSLKDLNLSDCNIVDGSQLSSLSPLLSLKKLNLSGNEFASLPSSISQFPLLTVLKLLNCRRLGALPELPSSVEVINAHNCISLETISNQSHYTGLRHAIFTNCFKMKEHQSNMESSFGTVVANIHQFGSRSSYPQDHGRPLLFRILIPGSEIPDWFSHQNKGCRILIKSLPKNWNNSNFLGFALCAVLGLKDLIHQEMHYLTYGISAGSGDYSLPVMSDFIPHRFEDGLIESDHIWMAYAPAPLCERWADDSVSVEVWISGSGDAVKSCGFRLVYAEDVRDYNATMIQHISPPQHSSVILEELDHSIPEDGKAGSSLDPREPSGSGCSYTSLELENEDEYYTAEDLSSSDCSNEDLESKSIDYCYTHEEDQALAEGTARMQEQWMRANAVAMTHTPATEHRKKRAKILK